MTQQADTKILEAIEPYTLSNSIIISQHDLLELIKGLMRDVVLDQKLQKELFDLSNIE